MDVLQWLRGTARGDIAAAACAMGYRLAPWGRPYAEVRGTVICYPAATPPDDVDGVIYDALIASRRPAPRSGAFRVIVGG